MSPSGPVINVNKRLNKALDIQAVSSFCIRREECFPQSFLTLGYILYVRVKEYNIEF